MVTDGSSGDHEADDAADFHFIIILTLILQYCFLFSLHNESFSDVSLKIWLHIEYKTINQLEKIRLNWNDLHLENMHHYSSVVLVTI